MSRQFDEVALQAAKILDDKKAEDIVLIDVADATILAETFIIASGGSPTQVRMLADEVQQQLGKQGVHKRRVEGYRQGRWVVVDFGHVLVHVFHREERAFYDIERLWKSNDNSMDYTLAIAE